MPSATHCWRVSVYNAGLQEGWEPGQAFRDMEHRLQAVARQRADIEEARKVRPLAWASPQQDLTLHCYPLDFCPKCRASSEHFGHSETYTPHVPAVTTLQLAKKRLPPPGHPLSAPSTSPQPNGTAAVVSPSSEAFISPEDYVAQDEIYKASRISNLYSGRPFLQWHGQHCARMVYPEQW